MVIFFSDIHLGKPVVAHQINVFETEKYTYRFGCTFHKHFLARLHVTCKRKNEDSFCLFSSKVKMGKRGGQA